MKLIGKKKFGQDGDVECPVFTFNNSEAKLMLAVLKKANIYIPSALQPDDARFNNMIKCLEGYLRTEGRLDKITQP